MADKNPKTDANAFKTRVAKGQSRAGTPERVAPSRPRTPPRGSRKKADEKKRRQEELEVANVQGNLYRYSLSLSDFSHHRQDPKTPLGARTAAGGKSAFQQFKTTAFPKTGVSPKQADQAYKTGYLQQTAAAGGKDENHADIKAQLRELAKQDPDAAVRLRALYPDIGGLEERKQEMRAIKGRVPDGTHSSLNKECLVALIVILAQVIGVALFIYALQNFFREDTASTVAGSYDRTADPSRDENSGYGPVYTMSARRRRTHSDRALKRRGKMPQPSRSTTVSSRSSSSGTHNRTTMCVFQSRSEGLAVNGRAYSADNFMYEYCDVVIYCCLNVVSGYGIVPRQGQEASFDKFRVTATKSRHVNSVGAAVGGLEDDALIRRLFEASVDEAQDHFTKHAVNLAVAKKFQRIYLYWPMSPGFKVDNAADAFNRVHAIMSRANISMGLVVRQGFELHGFYSVAAQLGDSLGHASLLVVPPSYVAGDFRPRVLTYYNGLNIAKMAVPADITVDGAATKVCVLLPGWSLVSHVTNATYPIRQTQASVGPGPGGPTTRTGGHWASYETCHAVESCATRDSWLYFMWALCNATWISYPTPDLLLDFICAVQRRTGLTCFGLWDSDADDFADSCEEGVFPLMEAVFEIPLRSCPNKTCNSDDFPC
ncbi:uncharacterized protein LOC135398303 isoform X1 [Ornithodoros turicata]|uniref:uncharacterized protein LOC135398303 isoform X1 n=1 Tax=Ornithodoros turicata TaxID=34597 RepID=UPI0031393849